MYSFAPIPVSRALRVPWIPLALASAGCGSDFQGQWKGECSVGLGSNGETLPVNVELVDTGGGTLGGKGSFEYNEAEFEGVAKGRVVDDEALKVEIEGVYGGYVILLELETTMDFEGELEGVCAFTDQETLYEGDVLLSIVGE